MSAQGSLRQYKFLITSGKVKTRGSKNWCLCPITISNKTEKAAIKSDIGNLYMYTIKNTGTSRGMWMEVFSDTKPKYAGA